jgi:4-alpha-glucanotransferase
MSSEAPFQPKKQFKTSNGGALLDYADYFAHKRHLREMQPLVLDEVNPYYYVGKQALQVMQEQHTRKDKKELDK